ncbi:MAG TPA: twin-arginine translocase subunit TatC, partial [Tenacibaculum sp.]|nr:twin-arginine translocase subunit TatC [Tenacibaculum sp.]
MAIKEMSFLEHLEELRWHLVRSFIAVFIAGIFIFANINFV